MMDFNDMEIMLGPKTSDEDKTNCISLIKRYCPNYKITIKDSELRGKIRWKDNSFCKSIRDIKEFLSYCKKIYIPIYY